MTRAAMTALLVDNDEAIEAYERHHQAVWPEVLADNERCGAQRIFIYRDGRRLFMFLEAGEGFDIDQFGACIASGYDRTRRWLELMDGYLVDGPDTTEGMKWTVMHEVCALGEGGQRS